MKKVIWEDISGTFDSECYQSVVKTDKSLIVDNGKTKVYYKLQDVKDVINNYNNSTEYDKLDRLFRDLQAYKPYKKTARNEIKRFLDRLSADAEFLQERGWQ